MFSRSIAVFCLTVCVVAGAAQQPMDNQSIVKMHEAGMSDDLIVTTINAQAGTYSTSTDDLIALKKAGIDEKVITAMVVKGSAPPAPIVQAPLPPSAEQQAPLQQTPPSPGDINGKPRVFLTSASKGPNQNAARDQSMEMSKDFERDCTEVRITLNQQMADYTISLNHIEVGLLVRDNQFQIGDRNGDLISRTKEGGSIANGVRKACNVILANWQASHPPTVPPPPASAPASPPAIQK